jgi:hypothetical protein
MLNLVDKYIPEEGDASPIPIMHKVLKIHPIFTKIIIPGSRIPWSACGESPEYPPSGGNFNFSYFRSGLFSHPSL